jgi:hypothetical protein
VCSAFGVCPNVRYVHNDQLDEEFLFCTPLLLTTKAVDIFKVMADFFSKHNISLSVIGSICTDGAPAMLGSKSGFAALLKKEIPQVLVTHCFLHRHALAAKTLPLKLKQVMDTSVAIVKEIKNSSKNTRIF